MFKLIISSIPDPVSSSGMEIWVPAVVSLISLFINIVFTIFVAPKVLEKSNYKNKLLEISGEFLEYLSKVISYDDFCNVPTTVRSYSLQIHLLFKSGTAPQEISDSLERIFQLMKERKKTDDSFDQSKWENEVRTEMRNLRRQLAKYTGSFGRM